MGSWKLRVALLVCACLLTSIGLTAGAETPHAAAGPQPADDQVPASAGAPAAGEIIVRFDRRARGADRSRARSDARTEITETLPVTGLQVVETDPGVSVREGIARLERSDAVLYAEPNVRRNALARPNDTYFGYQWGLDNSGQSISGSVGTADADIDAPEAWDVTTGSRGITVAVIDTGVDPDHPDLAPNAWRNPGETGDGREANGVDDDGNGFVDDWRGWDWVDGDNAPSDLNGHGTHVAGTAAARGNDGTGVAGVAWQASVLPLRVLGADGSGYVSDAIKAYAYAGRAKIRVANASLGGSSFSRAERDALAAARETLFVVAAGNDGADNDATPSYPCNHDVDNVVCVAATDKDDALAGFSNYGAASVDLAAPGVAIASTLPNGEYGYKSGTSMAAPHVAGAAALVWAEHPAASVADVRRALLGGADPTSSLSARTVTGARLNVNGALARASGAAPAATEAQPPAGTSGDAAPPPGEAAVEPSLAPAPPQDPIAGGAATPAPAPVPGDAIDTSAPRTSIGVARRQSLPAVLRRGIRTSVRCSEACTLRAGLSVSGTTAKRLRLASTTSRTTLGTARSGRRSAGSVTFYLKLSSRARQLLRRSSSVPATLEVRAVDPAGNSRVVRVALALRR